MKKRGLKVIQLIAWALGFIALGLLIYGIIRALV
jgi:hypothetical protein